MNLHDWLHDNPPKDMPFYPNARVTESFGLRTSKRAMSLGASPIHLGVDRAGGDRGLMNPFPSQLHWKLLPGSSLGSLLQLNANDIDLELQVFHTEAINGTTEILQPMFHVGTKLPVLPGELGMSTGVHTHTEVLMPYTDELKRQCTAGTEPFVEGGKVYLYEVISHCAKARIPSSKFLEAMREQIDNWQIREVWPHFAVRESMVRAPWIGPIALIDSMWLLQI